MKIVLSSEFDCLLEIEGIKYEMIADVSSIVIDKLKHENLCGVAYPINNRGLLSYAFDVSLENQTSSNVKIFKLGEDEFEVVLKPYYLAGHSFYKKKFEHQNMTFTFCLSYLSELSCEIADETYVAYISENIQKFKFDVLAGVVVFQAFISGGCQLLLVFDSQNKKFLKYVATSIEFEETQIKLRDESKQTILVIENSCVTEKVENFENLARPKNLGMLPLCFLQAVRERNFDYARSLLSVRLRESVSEDVLKDYFGDIEKFKPYNFHKDKGYFVCVYGKDKVRVFNFLLNDNEIIEIN